MDTQTLPIKNNPWCPDAWATLIRWGVTRHLGLDESSFCKCTFPDGWKVVPIDEQGRANLVDSSGLIRAEIHGSDTPQAYITVLEKRFVIRQIKKEDRSYISEQYQVYDQGLNRPIFIGDEVKCIIVNKSLGAIQCGDCYLFSGGSLEKIELPQDVIYLSMDEFSVNWCDKPGTREFARSIRRMASLACEDQLKALPGDDSAW